MSGKLYFKDYLTGPVLSGKKTATTRIGIRKFKAGEAVPFCGEDGRVLGTLLVERTDIIDLAGITEALASAENLSGPEELIAALLGIYGQKVREIPLTAIYFKVQDSEQ